MDLVYNYARYLIYSQQLDLVNDTIKCMIVTDEYVPDPTQRFVDENSLISAVNFEVEGTGYESGYGGSGRLSLLNKMWDQVLETNAPRFIADNLIWNPLNVGLTGAVLLIKEGENDDSESILIEYLQSGGFPRITDGGEFLIRWNDNGILA